MHISTNVQQVVSSVPRSIYSPDQGQGPDRDRDREKDQGQEQDQDRGQDQGQGPDRDKDRGQDQGQGHRNTVKAKTWTIKYTKAKYRAVTPPLEGGLGLGIHRQTLLDCRVIASLLRAFTRLSSSRSASEVP